MDRTYTDVCNEISALEKEIADSKETKMKKIIELKKERDLLWKDYQNKKLISYRKYIGKLCFVGNQNNKTKEINWNLGKLSLVTKTRSKERPFMFQLYTQYGYYDFFKVATIEDIDEFIYKE